MTGLAPPARTISSRRTQSGPINSLFAALGCPMQNSHGTREGKSVRQESSRVRTPVSDQDDAEGGDGLLGAAGVAAAAFAAASAAAFFFASAAAAASARFLSTAAASTGWIL